MAIGEIVGIEVGSLFQNRAELAAAGVHRATQAGITGRAEEGAESIVLSGGYIDDEDLGDVIIYTGHGGRDPISGRQIDDQTFTRQNKALVSSALHGHPVRVIRGSQHRSQFSPATGYRYDGLYRVDRYWPELGKDGFKVCRFKLVKTDYADIPFLRSEADATGTETAEMPARRIGSQVLRIIRDTALGKHIKTLYDYRCQVCGETLMCQGGMYAEAAHI